MPPLLSLKQVSKIYSGNEQPAVDKLSLDLETGEIFGLLGPNGAGKTTTLNICCGLLPATAGTIRLQGKAIHLQHRQWRRQIGLVPQDIALYPTLTARENLQYFARIQGLTEKKLSGRIYESLEQLGLLPAADRKLNTYSGGMKRRVNLLAAILHRPALLFLDEPTVGVDVQSRAVVLDFLKQLNREGTTIFYTSHHLQEAEQLCDRVAIMDYGRIIAIGTPQELVSGQNGGVNLEDVFLNLTGRKIRD